ncbi:MAG: AI-2E family transporter [Flavobacteriales bacterium]
MKWQTNEIAKGILQACFVILFVCVCVWFLYAIRIIITYIAIAAVVSLIGSRLVKVLKRLKIPNVASVIATLLIIVTVVSTTVGLLVPLISSQSQNLSLLDIQEFELRVDEWLDQVDTYLSQYHIHILTDLKDYGFFNSKNLQIIPNLLNQLFGVIGNFTVGLLSVLFISFFFMLNDKNMSDPIYALIPQKYIPSVKRALIKIHRLLSQYFLGLFLQLSILFAFYTLILLVFGIPNAIVIAFLAALLNIIPYLGPFIGGILMTLLALSSQIGQNFMNRALPTALYILSGYLLAQVFDNFVSQPLIYSNSVKSHPLEIFLVILTSGTLFGIVGMIIAIPAYTALKVILKEFFSEFRIVQYISKNL